MHGLGMDIVAISPAQNARHCCQKHASSGFSCSSKAGRHSREILI